MRSLLSTGVCAMNLSDAAEENRSVNTRENERECICDGCQIPAIDCIGDIRGCEEEAREEAADDKVKARKEES